MRLIDADALIAEWYRVNDIDENDRGARFVGYTEIVRMINSIPTIEPERRKGEWIEGKCNHCGEHAPYWCMASTYYRSNFCPHCGADMRGGGKE